jgi:hypothetical protein
MAKPENILNLAEGQKVVSLSLLVTARQKEGRYLAGP